MKRTAIIATASLITVFLAAGRAASQTYSCQQFFALQSQLAGASCAMYWPPLDFSNVAPTAVCCNPTGAPFGEMCIAPSASCAPPNAAQETCIACNRSRTAAASAPIDLATGNTFIEQTDISVPGLRGGLLLNRTWNSLLPNLQNSYSFMFGSQWRSTYEERVVLNSPDGYLKYLRADGSVWSYGMASAGAQLRYTAAAPGDDSTGGAWTPGSSSWTLSFKNGEKRAFSVSSGALLSITDRNGNTTTLTYDGAGRLATVTDPASRHLYFNYADGSTPLVSSVTSDLGITVSYAYDALGRLAQLTKADGETVSFEYDAQSLITAVKDSAGKVLESHTYDPAGRGLCARSSWPMRGARRRRRERVIELSAIEGHGRFSEGSGQGPPGFWFFSVFMRFFPGSILNGKGTGCRPWVVCIFRVAAVGKPCHYGHLSFQRAGGQFHHNYRFGIRGHAGRQHGHPQFRHRHCDGLERHHDCGDCAGQCGFGAVFGDSRRPGGQQS